MDLYCSTIKSQSGWCFPTKRTSPPRLFLLSRKDEENEVRVQRKEGGKEYSIPVHHSGETSTSSAPQESFIVIYEKVLKILIMSVPKTGGLWSHRLVGDRKTIRILCSVGGILNSEQRQGHRLEKNIYTTPKTTLPTRTSYHFVIMQKVKPKFVCISRTSSFAYCNCTQPSR